MTDIGNNKQKTGVNIRELILGILLEITVEDAHSHVVLRNVLEKYQYLDKKERAFIQRVCEGTLENMIRIDYILDQFSKVKTQKMKPVIRCIMRMSVYQLFYMDSVPASAVCNEAVKLAEKKGFHNLKGFVNGVLRNISRSKDAVKEPVKSDNPLQYLSVRYSMPMWIVEKWCAAYDFDTVEKMCTALLAEQPTTIRCNLNLNTAEELRKTLEQEGITVKAAPYLDYAFEIEGYDHVNAIRAFREGLFQIQDISSMLIGEIAAPKEGAHIIDVCAAPGGKSLHLADKLKNTGLIEARDLTEAKIELIEHNIERCKVLNVKAVQADALIFDEQSVEQADILLADLPCSGLGVLARKSDIKYKMSLKQQDELAALQREILKTVYQYVKVGGVLLYSTCTINIEENEDNLNWFLEHYPYRLDALDPYLPKELQSETTAKGYLQLLPGIHQADGFFMARLIREA